MSKIYEELSKAADLPLKRGVDRQDYLFDLVKAVASLKDPEWDALSPAAQEWYNTAADAKNAKKSTLPDFPDLEQEEEQPRRRRASAEDDGGSEANKIGVGSEVKGVTSRGKEVHGVVTEVDGDLLIIDDGSGGDLIEFNPKTAKSLDLVPAKKEEAPTSRRRRRRADDEGDGEPTGGPYEPKKGDEVTVTNKRGKVVTGKIIEVNDDMLVVDDGKDEHEFAKDRIESIVPKGGAAATSSRRSSSKDSEPAGETKNKRVSNGDVSIGQRISELVIDDMEASEADIAKALKKEGLEFKENTLSLNFKGVHKILDILKAKKKLK